MCGLKVRATLLPSNGSLDDVDWSRVRRAGATPTKGDRNYFRLRCAQEQEAAREARDTRVRLVHLEMAERYGALVRIAEQGAISSLVS